MKSLSWVTGDAGGWYLAVENLIDDLIVKQSSQVDEIKLTLTICLETRPCRDDAKAENRVVMCLSNATGQRRRAWSDRLMSMIESEITRSIVPPRHWVGIGSKHDEVVRLEES